jgi:pyruvate/2-oxoglutarate dehydrogenase complex dihydrolipoamide dehydrogenase (E3) component
MLKNAQADRTAPAAVQQPDLCILGGGPAGIQLATDAAACGKRVVLIEKHRLGGVSATTGTVPARTLSATAEVAATFRGAAPYGIGAFEPAVDWARVAARTREAIAAHAHDVAPERFAGLGIRIIDAVGRFVDPTTIAAGEHRIAARHTVVATGSSILVPAIEGLAQVPYLTTDSIFAVDRPIDHLIVVGAGAVGTELAQAYRRLGARVTLLDQGIVLGRFDVELTGAVKARLEAEGVVIHESARIENVSSAAGRIRVTALVATGPAANTTLRIDGSHLLIACGRKPNINDIGLDLARVTTTADGVKVDSRLRTTNPAVFAIGDVTGHPYSVQRAESQARLLTSSLLLGHAASTDERVVPMAVYTDPEIAVVGLSEAEARRGHGRVEVHRTTMRDNVRAMAGRAATGHLKVITDSAGRILGCGIVGRSAAELIEVWSLAISRGLSLPDMARAIAPHPTLAESSRRVALLRPAEMARMAGSGLWRRIRARLG